MAGEWREVLLGDVANLMTGYPFKSQHYTNDEDAPRLIGGDNIAQGNLRWDSVRRWPRDMTNGLDDYWLEPGDVVLAMDRPWIEAGLKRAAVGSQDVPSLLIQRTSRLRGTDELDTAFLRYVVGSQTFTQYILSVQTGTAVPHISPAQIRAFSFFLPPLAEQRAIAHILGTLDDKIELNRRRNQTLEAMARALFKDWFVDFGPVRARMECRKPYLPREIWNLFPERLDDEGKPEGWEMQTVGDCFHLTMGQSPPGDTYNDAGDGLPFFQGRTDFGFRYPVNRKFCSAPARVANAEDTLVSVRAPVGDINLAWEKCCVGRGVAGVRHISDGRSFTYHAIWSMQDELKQFEHTGTVFGAINKKQFEAIAFVEPSPDLIAAYENHAGRLDDAVRRHIEDSRTLVQLRDTLLPKLISGELRIADAERFLEKLS